MKKGFNGIQRLTKSQKIVNHPPREVEKKTPNNKRTTGATLLFRTVLNKEIFNWSKSNGTSTF